MASGHKWEQNDEILVCYLYFYGEDNVISRTSVASYIQSNDPNSLSMDNAVRMRIANFKSVDGKGGLSNLSKLTQNVYRRYKLVDKETHRKECLRIMGVE